ncbi:MAG: GDSL-type esterase/lipase family protein [Bacteroidales bacterium]|nr:GDSL-type esterase/lipase family protein [Bacteroidales bacterium]
MTRFFFVIILASFQFQSAFCQGDYYLGKKKYGFIQYDSNLIHTLNSPDPLEGIYHKIDSMILLGKGKLNIVHIGGSHIQADVYTHLMRKQMQSIDKDMNGGRGMIFPFRMARTNNPRNYSVRYTGSWSYCKSTLYKRTCDLGLTAMQVSTSSPKASININPNTDSTTYYQFNTVKIFHNNNNYDVKIRYGDHFYEGKYDEIAGATIINTIQPIDHLQLLLQEDTASSTPFVLYGISLESDDDGIVYHSIGVNGSMLKHYLKCELYEKHLAALNPDLVIFSIGTNDGYTRSFNEDAFYERYATLLERTLDAAPQTKIMITVPNDSYLYRRYANKNTIEIRDKVFKLAHKYNAVVWDFFTIMGGLNSSQTWYNYQLMQYDRIHFTRKGYELKGELFFSAFLKSWENRLSDSPLKSQIQ